MSFDRTRLGMRRKMLEAGWLGKQSYLGTDSPERFPASSGVGYNEFLACHARLAVARYISSRDEITTA